MSQSVEDEGDEVSATPSNAQGTPDDQRQSGAPATITPAQQLQQQTPDGPESFSRTRQNFTPSTDSGPSAPRSGRGRARTLPTMDPFMEEDEEEENVGSIPDTGSAAQPLPARDPVPTPTRAPPRRSISFDYSVPSADAPLHYPDETRVRTSSILRNPAPRTPAVAAPSPVFAFAPPPSATLPSVTPPSRPSTPAPAGAPSPSGGSQPVTSPNPTRRNLNPFPVIRNWWSPRKKTSPEQRLGPSPENVSTATGHGEQVVQADAQAETAQPPSGSGRGGPEPAEVAGWGDHEPAEWESGEWDRSGSSEAIPYGPKSRLSVRPGTRTSWERSVRGQDDYDFDGPDSQSRVRARAFDKVLEKVRTVGLFQDERLFDRTRYHVRTQEPKIDLEVLDTVSDESIRTIREWLIEHGRDAPQELQDRFVGEVTRVLGSVRDDIGTLVTQERTYVKDFADNLEILLMRPPGRTRSHTSRASSEGSAPLPESDYEELDRERLRKLSKEAILDFLFTRDAQRAAHIANLQAVCENLEGMVADREEVIQQQEITSIEQVATEQQRVQVAIDSVMGTIPSREFIPGRPTASRQSSGNTRAPRSRATTLMTSSSSGSQRFHGPGVPGVTTGSAPATAPLTAPGTSPMPIEAMDQPVDESADPIRQQLLEDLQDIWRNAETVDELSHRFIREAARGANIPIRPGMEEGGRLNSAALEFATAESTTPAQLVARIQQVTMERDRARRAETEAQGQLLSQAATQQQPVMPSTGLMRRIAALRGGQQPASTAMATPATPAPPTAPLNHSSLVRLLRIVSQLADELSGCSNATSNLAQTMARCGRMNTERSPVLPALNNLRAIVRTLRTVKPENPTDNDISGGNEMWQALYLDELEAYMTQVRRQVTQAIGTLDSNVGEWYRTNQGGSDNTGSDAQRRRSTQTGHEDGVERPSQQSEVARSAAGSTNEHADVVNVRPLIAGWPANHPNQPCEHCTPVLQVPVGLGEIDICGCTCGTGDGVEESVEESRSQRSGRSVSFADERPGILRNGRRGTRPGRLDLSTAESYRSGSSRGGGNRPSTPHPLGSASARGSDLPSLERATSVPPVRHNCNCNCRKGVRVAYFMCSNVAGQVAEDETSQAQIVDRSQAARGTQPVSEEPRSIERWIVGVASDMASLVGWGSPWGTYASSHTAAQDPSQIPLPPSSASSSRTPPPSVPSARMSPHTPPGQPQAQTPPGQSQAPSPRRTPIFPETSGRRGRRATAPANLGNPLTCLPRVPEAGPEDNNVPAGTRAVDGGHGDEQPAEEQSGYGQPGDQQTNDDQPGVTVSDDQQPGSGPASEEAPAPPVPQPATRGPILGDLLLHDPFLAVLHMLWNIILFFTFEQLRNSLVILWFFLSAVRYYVRLLLYVVLRFLAGQNVACPRGPILPRFELFSLFSWIALVWISSMSIALNEERRIWRNANPQIALSYFRGMPYRRLYPWWTFYLVDTDLIEPALGGLSGLLHERLIVRT